ncbi:RNA pseudouridylate synthase, putative [Babesia microti strain RI]|uniref:RNA pseudouridylate synthase, putative n=1 Tax=Babesia microti (strain RI) TaxID=1133968 RepID=A0A1N6LWF0_BABMR|nr:RNA pseudouridylate synthase, putative [Babesia microti strain RI]SIO73200.1 RNA pseudouridylate synthase, putative [Babesia microti strain RI]|eukprot:XP_021337308.1 RNA pseudouridylate synthase, putative [Babesia microti strain RI]
MCSSATVQLRYTQVELLSKRLSQHLTSSDSKKWIREGKVFVNGKVAQRNALITNNCVVTLNEPNVTNVQKTSAQLWIAYKCRGVDSTDVNKFISHINPTLNIPKLIAINKLSSYSQGVMLMTNNGSFAQKLRQLDTGLTSIYHLKLYCHLHEAMSAVKYLKKVLPVHWISLVKQGWRSVWLKCTINNFNDKTLINGFRSRGLLPSKVRLDSIGPYKVNRLDRTEVLPVKLTKQLAKIANKLERVNESIALVPLETDGLWPPRIISTKQSVELMKTNNQTEIVIPDVKKHIES